MGDSNARDIRGKIMFPLMPGKMSGVFRARLLETKEFAETFTFPLII